MGDRVLVKVDKEETKSIGGVLIPVAAQSKPNAGNIVAAGDVSLVKVRCCCCCCCSSDHGGELHVVGGRRPMQCGC